ncbi:MAG: hypothetical protein K8T90_05310 [Planctomycetes bacterium]|nr:hypothetical protein [Planctomycetota bacterium]
MSDGLGDITADDDSSFAAVRLHLADQLMRGTKAHRREGMLIYRELIDHLRPDDPEGASRIVAVALAPGTVDPSFEALFGEVSAISADPDQVRATALAASQLAMQRGEFLRAEAALRRILRRADGAAQRIDALHRLGAVWMRQGMEHETTVASRTALDVPATQPEQLAYVHAHMLGSHGARQDWEAVLDELEQWERACAALPPEQDRPSSHTVALAASNAHLRRGDIAAAQAWLARIHPELADPAHAETLRPAVAFRAAGIAAATGERARAAEGALIVGRDERASDAVRVDALVLAMECLSQCGAAVRAAAAAEDWATLLHRARRRIGSGTAIRVVARALPTVTSVTANRQVQDLANRVAWDAIADRIEELARHTEDVDVPPGPADEVPLRQFRHRFDLAPRSFAAPSADDHATERALAVLGPAWRVCRTCLRVVRGAGPPIPVGHLVNGLPGRRDDVASCSACAT